MATMPSVRLMMPPDRDYDTIMDRTKIVYDQLLQDKNGKLLEALVQKKEEFDNKCMALSVQSDEEALEFGIRAQEYLNRMQKESEDELTLLQEDYQAKINKMAQAMEMQWRHKHGK